MTSKSHSLSYFEHSSNHGLFTNGLETVPPCIMFVQYRRGAQYGGGVQYRGRDTMSTVGGYLEYHGGVQYRGGIMINVGGYFEYRGGVQYCGGIS